VRGPKMVIAGAGMMNGGRILHHALRYLSDERSTLLIVGYQANGTLGRKLYDGDKVVKIFGEDVSVKCTIKAIGGLSAHADQTKILSWVGGAKKLPTKVFCVHGEPEASVVLADKIKNDLGINCYVPKEGEEITV